MRQAQGEALYAMELALSLEKLNFTKLRELWKTANEMEDGQLTDFIGMPSFFYNILISPSTTKWCLCNYWIGVLGSLSVELEGCLSMHGHLEKLTVLDLHGIRAQGPC